MVEEDVAQVLGIDTLGLTWYNINMRVRRCNYPNCIGGMIIEKRWGSFDVELTRWLCTVCNNVKITMKYIW